MISAWKIVRRYILQNEQSNSHRVESLSLVFEVVILLANRLPALIQSEFQIWNLPGQSESQDSAVGIATGYDLDDRGV
jgi:hypothetical protein